MDPTPFKSCELGYQKLGFFRHSLIGEFIDRMGNLWVGFLLHFPLLYLTVKVLRPSSQSANICGSYR
jgi:hypothetical protein